MALERHGSDLEWSKLNCQTKVVGWPLLPQPPNLKPKLHHWIHPSISYDQDWAVGTPIYLNSLRNWGDIVVDSTATVFSSRFKKPWSKLNATWDGQFYLSKLPQVVGIKRWNSSQIMVGCRVMIYLSRTQSRRDPGVRALWLRHAEEGRKSHLDRHPKLSYWSFPLSVRPQELLRVMDTHIDSIPKILVCCRRFRICFTSFNMQWVRGFHSLNSPCRGTMVKSKQMIESFIFQHILQFPRCHCWYLHVGNRLSPRVDLEIFSRLNVASYRLRNIYM